MEKPTKKNISTKWEGAPDITPTIDLQVLEKDRIKKYKINNIIHVNNKK